MQPGVGTIPAQYACPYVRGRVQVVQARETLADEINALREREEQQQSSHSQARAVFRREFRGKAPMRSNGQPLPHPTLEPLLPPHLRSKQLHCAAYLREDLRKIAAAATAVDLPSPPALALPPPPPLFDPMITDDHVAMLFDAHEARVQTPTLAACSSSGAENPSSDTQTLPLMSVAEAAAAAKRVHPSEAAGEASTSDSSALGGYSADDLGRKADGRPPAKVVKPLPQAGEADIPGILPHHQTCGYQLERPRENTL